MKFNKNIALILFSVFILFACATEEAEETTPKSFDASFTNISMLDTNVNDENALDAGPEVSQDGLELYFHSSRTGGTGGLDLYVSKRATTDDSWGAATNVSSVNSTENDSDASLSTDGLSLFITSDRTGGQGAKDLYVSTRATVDDAWASPANLGNIVNTASNEFAADIASDPRLLFFTSDKSGGLGGEDIYASQRATSQDPWQEPVNLGSNINSSDFDAAPQIASDMLSLYFHSERTGGSGANSIWRATRPTIDGIWGAPVLIPVPVNSVASDTDAGLSSDWKSLYFSSDFRDIGGNQDIWLAD